MTMLKRLQSGDRIPLSKSFWNSSLGAGREQSDGRTPTANGSAQELGRYGERIIHVRNSGQIIIPAGRPCRVYKPKKDLGDNSRDLVLGDTLYEIVSYGNGDPIASSFCKPLTELNPGQTGRAVLIPGGLEWDIPIASAGGVPNSRKPPVWRWFAGLPHGGISFITCGRYVPFPATDDTSKFLALGTGMPTNGTQPATVPGYEILKIVSGAGTNFVRLRKAHASQMYVRGSARFYYEHFRANAGVSGFYYPGFTIALFANGSIVGQALVQPVLFNRCIADFPVGATSVNQLFDNESILDSGAAGSIPPSKMVGLLTISFDLFWDSQDLEFTVTTGWDTDFSGLGSGVQLPIVKYSGFALDFLEIRRNDNTNDSGTSTEPTIGGGGEVFSGDFSSPLAGNIAGPSLSIVAGSITGSTGTGTGGGIE